VFHPWLNWLRPKAALGNPWSIRGLIHPNRVPTSDADGREPPYRQNGGLGKI